MARDSGVPSPLTILRWTTLVVVVANIAFVADYSALGNSPTIAEVVAEYGDMIVPGGLAKAIGVAILVALALFYVDALMPRRPRIRIYDKLVIPLALTSVLATCWLVAFRHEEIALSAALVAAGAVLAGVMFIRVAAVSPSEHSGWLRVPFSLHFGAMTIALLAAATQCLHASGLLMGTAVVQDDVATAFLAIAVAAGGSVALRYRDSIYPTVIASGAGAMFIAQRTYNPHFAVFALVAFVGMCVVVVLAAVAVAQQPPRPKGVSSRRRSKVARRAQDEGWALMGTSSSIMRL